MKRGGQLYGEWLRQRSTYAEGPVDDENELVPAMISTPTPSSHAVLDKIDVLPDYMDIGGNWTDNRDKLLLTSIRVDVQAMA